MSTDKEVYDEAFEKASECHEAIWDVAKGYNREPKIYLHWTAGGYDTVFSDYHICIRGNGDVVYMVDALSRYCPATYMRNGGSVAVSLCCCVGATTKDLGINPPTEIQIERMAQVVAGLCEGLWLTCDKYHVLTHGEAANNEDGIYCHAPYAVWNDAEGSGDTRWDLEFLGTNESPVYKPFATDGTRGGDVLRGKANFYINKFRN